jgi:hypothetical protein
MKSAGLMVVLGVLAVSLTSSRGQTLDMAGTATIEGTLTNQTLVDSGTALNDGEVSTWVVSDSAVDSQGYIFIYQLENEGPDQVVGASFNSFNLGQFVSSESYSNVTIGGFELSSSKTVTSTLYPNFTFETVTAGGAATFGVFSPDPGLNSGTTSWFIVIDTDVTSFNTGYALTQDDFQAHGDILAPNYAIFGVPEPSSAVILLGGFACFYGVLRCRRAMD